MTILFSSGIENLHPVNDSFDAGELWVAYHGENRNKTFISKEAFEAAIPSIYNCPIVCNYMRAKDAIGSHDVDLIQKDGKVRMINITQPVGVIPESAAYSWKTVVENDGTEHEYLCVEFLLWKRQEAYEHIKSRGAVDESMEIRIKDGSRHDDGIYYIDSFEFLAFCLLESAAPCFESAHIELFAKDEFKEQYVQMMTECKQAFAAINASGDEADNATEGGNDTMNTSEMMPPEIQDENTPVNDQPDEPAAFSANGTGQADGGNESMNDGNENNAGGEPESQQFSLTAEQQREVICNVLRAKKYTDPYWGSMTQYSYCDHDVELGEIYAYDNSARYIVGLKYTIDGDQVVVDWDSAKHKKIVYVDFEDGEAETQYPEIAEAFAAAASIRDGVNEAELKELRTFRAETTKKMLQANAEKIFAAFADLDGNDAFEALKTSVIESGYELYADSLEEKCYALRGRYGTASFALNQYTKAPRLPIDGMSHADTDPDEPYNGVFKKFNIK